MSTLLNRRRDGAVEYVELNRPEVRNALNEHLIAELAAWAAEVAEDSTVRVVVLGGAGPAFSAGADLVWMSKMAGYTREENLRDASHVAAMFEALDTLPVPLIARVHGAAMGGGVGLVAIADIAVASDEAMFGLTEVRLGLIPSVVGPYVIAKIGQSAARELFLTGRRFPASHAQSIGLVHSVAASDQLDTVVQRVVDDLLAGGGEAIAAAKKLIRQVAGRSPAEVTQITAEAIVTRRASEEAKGRMEGFLKKK
jgi:methylglutaconyl-CoA hydratase